MPLPQSRIGRVVLLGIVLGILLVFVVAVSASVAFAQEAPPERKLRNSDEVACRTLTGLNTWLPKDVGGTEERTFWLMELRRTARELAMQCEESSALFSVDAWERQGWIETNQLIEHSMRRALLNYASTAQRTPTFRARAKKLEDLLEDMFFDVASLQTRESVRLNNRPEVIKEVVKTVEVPVQIPCPRCPDLVCPSVPECPQGPNPFEVAEERRRDREMECDRILRSAVRDWHNHLNTNYPWAKDEYGSALYAAGDINGQIAKCNNTGCRDLQSTVVGWERALGSMIEASGRGPGGMAPQVLQRVISLRSMMAAKLESCRGGGRR